MPSLELRRAVLVRVFAATLAGSVAISALVPSIAQAQVTAFRQAVAEAVVSDEDLAEFYRAREFAPVWSGTDQMTQNRRNALLAAFAGAGNHGLPAARYDANAIMARLRAAETPAEQGAMDVELSRLFMRYASDVQTGVLTPGRVDSNIKREVPLRDRIETIDAFLSANPDAFLRDLPPSSPEYVRLMRVKMRLERLLAAGGYGTTVPATLAQGASGDAVVTLRNRLILMGFLERTATQTYDLALARAVERFQEAHGLAVDGTVGDSTLRALNVPVEERLQSIIVAMERERWTNQDRGDRHIWVNLTDFSAAIVDNDIVTFKTRSVISATDSHKQSPEFSDEMEFMVINPSWYVPRSIATREYLPQLQRNSGAVSHLEIRDSNGRVVNRNNVNFANYNARTFPFSMRQPPSTQNALGLVKFMFPNQYNIYLHDTPAKSLFGHNTRAYSHGCIRLNDPFDFAYALLAAQESDPEAFFQSRLRTGAESRVNLETHVPVHIVYRTAFTDVTGTPQFRRDIYGRDGRIWTALEQEGVALRAAQG